MIGIIPFKPSDWKRVMQELTVNPLWIMLNKRRAGFKKKSGFSFSMDSAPKHIMLSGIVLGLVLLAVVFMIGNIFDTHSVREINQTMLGGIVLGYFLVFRIDLRYYRKQINNIIKLDMGEHLATIPWKGEDIFNAFIIGPAIRSCSKRIGLLIPAFHIILTFRYYSNNLMQLPILFFVNFVVIIFVIFLLTLNSVLIQTMKNLGVNKNEWQYIPKYSIFRPLLWFFNYSGWIFFLIGLNLNQALYVSPLFFIISAAISARNINHGYNNLKYNLSDIFKDYLSQNNEYSEDPGNFVMKKDRVIMSVTTSQHLLYKILNVPLITILMIVGCELIFEFVITYGSSFEMTENFLSYFALIVFLILSARMFLVKSIFRNVKNFMHNYYRTYSWSFYYIAGTTFFMLIVIFNYILLPDTLSPLKLTLSEGLPVVSMFVFYYIIFFVYYFLILQKEVYLTEKGIFFHGTKFASWGSVKYYSDSERKKVNLTFHSNPSESSISVDCHSEEEYSALIKVLNQNFVQQLSNELQNDNLFIEKKKKSEEDFLSKIILLSIIFIGLYFFTYLTDGMSLARKNKYGYYDSDFWEFMHGFYPHVISMIWVIIYAVSIEWVLKREHGNWKDVLFVSKKVPKVKKSDLINK